MSRAPRIQGPPCLDAETADRGGATVDNTVERIVGSIGLKVFSHRKRMGLSLQQLAERSDVSAAAIHKIEQGGMVPTITTLLKIAGALGRPVSYFVEEEVGQDDVAVLTPPDESRPVFTSHEGIQLDSISGPYGRFMMAGARARVAPGASSGRKPMQHPGEELVHVISGTLAFTVTGQPYLVGPGSTLHFRGDQPHTWHNAGSTEVRAVWLALRPQ
jgi:transcriptional regulator with XRE-family HTH domain